MAVFFLFPPRAVDHCYPSEIRKHEVGGANYGKLCKCCGHLAISWVVSLAKTRASPREQDKRKEPKENFRICSRFTLGLAELRDLHMYLGRKLTAADGNLNTHVL